MISRQVAAGTVRGGRITNDARAASPASASSATAIRCPVGPVSASSRPGSGLTASDLMLARPSGKAIVFCSSDLGPSAATGPTTAATTASAVTARLTAARRPSRAASSTTATSRPGQAVAFMAAAAPSASPAATGRGGCHSSANPRHRQASTGTSVPPTVSESAITGEAVTSAVQRTTSLARAIARASPKAATNAIPNQIRGSVTGENPSSTRGMPKAVSAGRYGSNTFGL